ncbi:MAG: hypothetical protein ISR73_14365 [Gammaproteobacteria bacterium]|nr:hypothetical protein [Gammaproteobacteria bacterium]
MKKAVASSVTLMIAGSIIVFLSQFMTLDNAFPALVSYLGFISIFGGVLVMLVTLITVMFPAVSQQLEQCQH